MECKDIDELLKGIRAKIVKGAVPTRARRLRGCLRTINVDHPTFGRSVGTQTVKVESEEMNTMSLSDAIQRFRSLSEANLPAPAPSAKTPDGKSQMASKTKFDLGATGQKKHDGKPASIPADAEGKGPSKLSTQGVSGPGYDASGREKVDTRYESVGVDDFQPTNAESDVAFAEAMLRDEVGRMKPMQEANIPAPPANQKAPDGKAQISPKSGFRKNYKGADLTYDSDKASIPADKEAMDADVSSGGTDGPGYTADGREEMDVRSEE